MASIVAVMSAQKRRKQEESNHLKKLRMQELTIDPATAALRHKYARFIQAMAKGSLARKEMQRSRADALVEFDRATLLSTLKAAIDSRRTHWFGVGFLIYLAFVVAFCSVTINSSEYYAHAGYVKDTILSNEWASGSAWDGVRSHYNFYSFLDESIIKATQAMGTQMFLGGFTYNLYDVTAGFTIVTQRGGTKPCSDIYDTGNGLFSKFDYNGDVCNLPLSDGIDQTNFGNTTIGRITKCFAIDPKDSDDLGNFLDGTACPSISYNEAFPFFDVGHVCRVPTHSDSTGEALTQAEMLKVSAMMSRCNFIDQQTRRVWIEIPLASSNTKPTYSWLEIRYDIDLSGAWTASYNMAAFVMKTAVTASAEDTAYVLVEILCVLSFVGLFIIVLDFLVLVWTRGRTAGARYLKDAWTYFAMGLYVCTIVFCFKHFDLVTLATLISEENSYLKFRVEVQQFMTSRRTYNITLGVLCGMSGVKILSYFRHQGMLSMLTKSIEAIMVPMAHFLFSMSVVLMSFALTTWFIFGSELYNYSTMLLSIETLANIAFGDFDYAELKFVNPVSAFILFYTYQVAMVLVLMNFFVAIVMEGYGAIYSKSNVNTPIWTEMVMSFTARGRNMVSAKQIATWDLMWLVERSKSLNGGGRGVVTLRDVRRACPYQFSRELTTILEGLLEDAGEGSSSIDRVSLPPYRYIGNSEFVRLEKVGRLRLHWLPSELRAVLLSNLRFCTWCGGWAGRPRRRKRDKRNRPTGVKIVPLNLTVSQDGSGGDEGDPEAQSRSPVERSQAAKVLLDQLQGHVTDHIAAHKPVVQQEGHPLEGSMATSSRSTTPPHSPPPPDAVRPPPSLAPRAINPSL